MRVSMLNGRMGEGGGFLRLTAKILALLRILVILFVFFFSYG